MKFGNEAGESPLNNVHQFLDRHLIERPSLEVFRWVDPNDLSLWMERRDADLPHRSLNVATLHQLVDRAAWGFSRLGIKKGDRAIVFIPMSVPMYVSMFALQKIGAIPVFLDSWARRDQLGLSCSIVSPCAIISVERAFEYLSGVSEIASIPLRIVAGPAKGSYNAHLEALMSAEGHIDVASVEPEHTGLITFTTGSSGKPKGANRTHRFLFSQHEALDPCIPYSAADVDLPVFPIFSLNNLAAGVSTVIPAFDIGTPGPHDPEVILAQIKACHVTCVTLSPSLFNRLSAFCLEKKIMLPELRRVVTGGAPVSVDNVSDMQKVAPSAEVLILFGSTEVEPMAHITGQEMLELSSKTKQDPRWVDQGVNVGKMVDSLRYRFLRIRKDPVFIKNKSDWDSLTVRNGEIGELIVAGKHVCEGYYNDDEAFVRAKIRDVDGVVWHRTGDLGRVDELNNLWIVGRVHNAIVRKGEYLFPVRAEMVLKKLDFVEKVAYLGVSDAVLGERTIAAMTLKDKTKDKSSCIELARSILDHNRIPTDEVLVLEDIPMDPRHHSKVEYERLRERLSQENLI